VKALAIESLPEQQLGFRRVLAGIYTHTSAHIVAAPMAHFMAKRSSRFWYSHDSFHMPCYGALQMLNEEKMIMRYRNVGGKQVTFHQAMNYLYRPKEMENSSMYQYYSETEFTSLSEATKMKWDSFEFTEEHPFHNYDAVIYRLQKERQDCVPVFSWKFIGSTKKFERSMMEEVLLTDPQYRQKEEYAKRFMIVFLPFRRIEDLMEGGSYQCAFQTAYKEEGFSSEMIEIANNIQAIQNSIDSAIPENCLSSRTSLPEADEFESNADEDAMGYEDLLSSIGDMFAAPEGVRLGADSTQLNPDFCGVHMKELRFAPEERAGDVEELFSVIQTCTVDEASAGTEDDGEENLIQERFRTATMELNSLLLRRRELATREEEAAGVMGENLVAAADASGSWESVVNWGRIAQLDAEQEVAFQVLAATYVLTFYDEANVNHSVETEVQSMKENRLCLMKLARMDPEKPKMPLRMFVTGPAGAGKCKQQIIV
jgi:hypothetical protein